MCLLQSRDVSLSIMLWKFPKFFKFIQDFIYVHVICKFKDDPIKTEWVMLMIKSNIGFSNNQGDVAQTNDLLWWSFKLIQDFIHVHLSANFKLIKTEWVMLMTESNRGFFSNQEDETLRFMTQSGQFLNPPETSPTWNFIHVHLICKFQTGSKLKEFWWWQSQTEAFAANKEM